MSKELNGFSVRDYLRGKPLPVNHAALLAHAEPVNLEARAKRIQQSENASGARHVVRKIILERVEGVARKLRKLRPKGQSDESIQPDEKVVKVFVAGHRAQKRMERRREG